MSDDEKIISIKNELQKGIVHYASFKDVLKHILSSVWPVRRYIICDDSATKRYLIERLSVCGTNIIYTNSSRERFEKDMMTYDAHTYFANVKNCNDLYILEMINNTNNNFID